MTIVALVLSLAGDGVALLAILAVRGYARELDERLDELERRQNRRR